MSVKMIKIKQVHSQASCSDRQKKTVKGLGFNRLQEVREVVDTPSIRGMIRKVHHLVKILGE